MRKQIARPGSHFSRGIEPTLLEWVCTWVHWIYKKRGSDSLWCIDSGEAWNSVCSWDLTIKLGCMESQSPERSSWHEVLLFSILFGWSQLWGAQEKRACARQLLIWIHLFSPFDKNLGPIHKKKDKCKCSLTVGSRDRRELLNDSLTWSKAEAYEFLFLSLLLRVQQCSWFPKALCSDQKECHMGKVSQARRLRWKAEKFKFYSPAKL